MGTGSLSRRGCGCNWEGGGQTGRQDDDGNNDHDRATHVDTHTVQAFVTSMVWETEGEGEGGMRRAKEARRAWTITG